MRTLLLGFVSCCAAGQVTFNKDVAPILQHHCQSCHRPGQAAPMSLLSYQAARPWAKAIRNAVIYRKMPPWPADPAYGHFSNDPSLQPSEIDTLANWANSGAVEGDPQDLPAAIQWPDGGWQIQPDVIVSLPPYRVPANGIVEWNYVTVPTGFAKDTWVTSIEILPSDPSVVHHAALFVNDLDAVAVYVPGFRAMDFRIHDAAQLIPAQTNLRVQLHYTPNGKEVTEITRIGFTLAKAPPKRRFITYSPQNPALSNREVFHIPAGDPNWKSPPVDGVFRVDAELVWFLPHMHLRGKDMTYTLTYPNGESQILLRVPKYDFDWQIGYDAASPIRVTKGTRLHVDAHYDNSANNKANPDPTLDVYGGTQTWQEMMVPFLGVVVETKVDPSKVITFAGRPADIR
jgi:hypothetical protein